MSNSGWRQVGADRGGGLEYIAQPNANDEAISIRVDGEVYPRVVLEASGSILVGDGTVAPSHLTGETTWYTGTVVPSDNMGTNGDFYLLVSGGVATSVYHRLLGTWVLSGTFSGTTPAAHASTHASGGSDPVTLAESQITNLTTDLAAKLAKASGLADLTSAVDINPPATTTPNGNTHLGSVIRYTPGVIVTPSIDMTKGPVWAHVDSSHNAVTVQTFSGTLTVDSTHDLPTLPAGGTLRVTLAGYSSRVATFTYTSHTASTFGGCVYVSGANSGDKFTTSDYVQTVVNTINTDSTLGTPILINGELDVDYDGGPFGVAPYTTTTTISGLSFPRGMVNVETLIKAKLAAGFAALMGLPPVFQNAVSVVNQNGVAANLFLPEGFIETPTLMADSAIVTTPGLGSTTFGAPGQNQGWHLGFWNGPITATLGTVAATVSLSAASYESGVIIYTLAVGKTLPPYAQRVTIAGFSPSGYNLAAATQITPLDSTHFMVTASDPGSSPATGTGTATFSASLSGLQEDSISAHMGVAAGVQAWVRYGLRVEDAVTNANGWLGFNAGLVIGKLANDGRTLSKMTGGQTNVGIINASSTALVPDAAQTVTAGFTLTAAQCATSHVTLVTSPDTAGTNVAASTTTPVIDGPWRYDVNAWVRVSASSFEVRDPTATLGAGDVTGQFTVGTRLSWTQQTGLTAPPYTVQTKTGIVTASSYNSGTSKTTVTFSGDAFALFSPYERKYSLNGQQLTIVNGSVNGSITFTTATAAFLKLNSATRTLGPGGALTLLYNPTVGAYVEIALSSGLNALNFTAIKTASYTAVAGDFVRFNISSSNLTLTLPTTPADSTQVGAVIVQGTQSTPHTVTVVPGGSDHLQHKRSDVATSYVMKNADQAVTFRYVAASALWTEISTGTPNPIEAQIVSKSSNYTMADQDDVVLATAALTVTLLDATTCSAIRRTIKNVSAGTVTIKSVSNQAIDDTAGATATATGISLPVRNTSLDLIADGTQWWIL